MELRSPEGASSPSLEGPAKLSVAVAVTVLALKAVAWRVTGSVALGSDAMESIVNVAAALAMWAAVRVAQRPPDANHPFGHGKAEYLSAVLEGVLVLVAAVEIAREALPRVLHPRAAEALGLGVAFSLAATALNGALGLYLLRKGRAHRSPALHADGVHVLTDVATSAGVLVGVGLARLTGRWVLDAVLALIVAAQIVWAGYGLVRRSVGGLMDETLDPAEASALRALIESAARAGGAVEVHGFRMRSAGSAVFCDLHMVVPGAMSVAAAHALCDEVERAVERAHPHVDVTIHVEPESLAETVERREG
jgi:cation diffusion facilitator family transporter